MKVKKAVSGGGPVDTCSAATACGRPGCCRPASSGTPQSRKTPTRRASFCAAMHTLPYACILAGVGGVHTVCFNTTSVVLLVDTRSYYLKQVVDLVPNARFSSPRFTSSGRLQSILGSVGVDGTKAGWIGFGNALAGNMAAVVRRRSRVDMLA